MSQAYAGTYSNVFNGATDVDAQGWQADVTVNVFDSTTTADQAWDDETPTTSRVEGSFDIFFNSSKTPASMGIAQGAIITLLKLYVNKTDSVLLSGKALIKGLGLKTKVKDGFTINVKFVNKGPWTLPS